MKTHSTNYFNTFIAVADDCPSNKGEIPAEKSGEKTLAGLAFEMISKNPYRYNSDDILFFVFAQRNDLTHDELDDARMQFFSKGQACFRTSALGKRYGWGLHFDTEGKVALYGCETENYQNYLGNRDIEVLKAMRSKKKTL